MKERPILFSAPMVRALLDGSKSQTRRIAKDIPYGPDTLHFGTEIMDWGLSGVYQDETNTAPDRWWRDIQCDVDDNTHDEIRCPYGAAGDRLYVRETFFAYGRWETRYSEKKNRDEWHFVDMTLECDRVYQYAADNPDVPLAKGRGATPGWWTRPAIFMPRAASRILREIASVRVERLNDCSEVDAISEGVVSLRSQAWDRQHFPVWRYQLEEAVAIGRKPPIGPSPVQAYEALWESLTGAGSWAANPFVWVIEFRRLP